MATERERLDLSETRWIDRPELLVERLLADADRPLVADCSGLCSAPGLLVQILVSARRTARGRGGKLVLKGVTPAFRAAVHRLGLGEEILAENC